MAHSNQAGHDDDDHAERLPHQAAKADGLAQAKAAYPHQSSAELAEEGKAAVHEATDPKPSSEPKANRTLADEHPPCGVRPATAHLLVEGTPVLYMNDKPGLICDAFQHRDWFTVYDDSGNPVYDDSGNPVLFKAADLLIRPPNGFHADWHSDHAKRLSHQADLHAGGQPGEHGVCHKEDHRKTFRGRCHAKGHQ